MKNAWSVVAAVVVFGFAASASARRQCYELSRDGQTWSRTPETLCVETMDEVSFRLTLATGIPATEVATFRYGIIDRGGGGRGSNRAVFGVTNPQGSVFGELVVRFDGRYDHRGRQEWGTVQIGRSTFSYRSTYETPPSAPPPPPPAPPPPVVAPPPPSANPMEPLAFRQLTETIRQAGTTQQVIEIIRSAARNNWFLSSQAVDLLRNIGDMNYRYEPARALLWRIVDRENTYLLFGAVTPEQAQRLRRERGE